MRRAVTRSIGPVLWQTKSASRSFATVRSLAKLDLAYDLHEPPSGNTDGVPIVFLHGLFGSKKNNRSISRAIAKQLDRPIYALDLRNHGDSPHATPHTYEALASDVLDFLHAHGLSRPTIIGHSMGAKTAMTVALSRPDLVRDIVAVDNAPADAALKSDFGGYVKGMRKVEEAGVGSQREADAVLKDFAKVWRAGFPYHLRELPVRQFLLTNLVKPKDGPYEWRIPLKTLGMALDNMADFPFKDPDEARFEGPALFVRGTKSHYVPDEMLPIIGRFFPRFTVADMDSGHWVISEQPEAFKKAVVDFLERKE